MTKKMMPYIKTAGVVVTLLIAALRVLLEGMFCVLKDGYAWSMDRKEKNTELFADRFLALAHIFGQDIGQDIRMIKSLAFGKGTASTLAQF